MSVKVIGSYGTFICDFDGKVESVIPNEGNDSSLETKKAFNSYLDVSQFNFEETDAFWEYKNRQESYDILDVGYTNKSGSCFPPDYYHRNMRMQIKPSWLTVRKDFDGTILVGANQNSVIIGTKGE